jgi:3,4-dihydroxy 2-butanone 4-phosphate synthase/GTP cyclohydrolase II
VGGPLTSVSPDGHAIASLLAELEAARARATCAERPFITLAYAQSVDGSIAAAPGQATALSGPEALRMTHALRAHHDAILVGIGTVLADDPQLNVRLVEGPSPRPVVVDSRLRTPPGARLLGRRSGAQVIIAGTDVAAPADRARLEARGARVLALPAWANGWVDLVALARQLAADGVRRLMVEGGAKIITSFLRARLVDHAVVTIAPRLLGGLGALGSLSPEVRPRLRAPAAYRLGDDIVLAGELQWPES